MDYSGDLPTPSQTVCQNERGFTQISWVYDSGAQWVRKEHLQEVHTWWQEWGACEGVGQLLVASPGRPPPATGTCLVTSPCKSMTDQDDLFC